MPLSSDDRPQIGDEFVFMAASPGAWGELTETVADVLHFEPSSGCWVVEYPMTAFRVPQIFLDKFGPSFGKARIARAGIKRGPDGRWWHEGELDAQ